ncbi:Glucokinase, partial [Frankliniella fusca]
EVHERPFRTRCASCAGPYRCVARAVAQPGQSRAALRFRILCCDMSEDVAEVLSAYGLGHLGPVCEEQGITNKADLLSLKERDFPVLSNLLGDHIKLRRLLEDNPPIPRPAVLDTQESSVDVAVRRRPPSAQQGLSHDTPNAVASSSSSVATTSGIQISLDSLRAGKRLSTSPQLCDAAVRKKSRIDYIKAVED